MPGFGSLTITDELDGAVVHTRKNRDLDIKVNICEACNTGWMHRLEEQVRGFLCPLMEGKPAVLSPAQQRLTARWTAKTLFALDLTRRGSRVIPEADYNWVMNRNVPPKNISRMWMIAYDGQEGGWKFVRKTLRFGPIGDDSDRIDGYCSTIRIGYLCLQIFGSFRTAEHLEPSEAPKMANHVLWPPTGRAITWPVNRLAIDDAGFADFANRFSPNLS